MQVFTNAVVPTKDIDGMAAKYVRQNEGLINSDEESTISRGGGQFREFRGNDESEDEDSDYNIYN